LRMATIFGVLPRASRCCPPSPELARASTRQLVSLNFCPSLAQSTVSLANADRMSPKQLVCVRLGCVEYPILKRSPIATRHINP
jgi:hypothetical protein